MLLLRQVLTLQYVALQSHKPAKPRNHFYVVIDKLHIFQYYILNCHLTIYIINLTMTSIQTYKHLKCIEICRNCYFITCRMFYVSRRNTCAYIMQHAQEVKLEKQAQIPHTFDRHRLTLEQRNSSKNKKKKEQSCV